MTQQFVNAVEAAKTLAANLSPRQIELEELERYAEGRQYAGRPDWFSEDVPLWERAPCIVYQMTATAIRSFGSLLLGKGHRPTVTTNPGEDDAEAEGLDPEQSKRVDRAIAALYTRTRFWSVARQSLKHAQQAKSVAVIAGARGGRPFLELVRSRWCEPTFDVHRRVTRLEIRYPYLQPEKQPDGRWRLAPRIYRRVIDAARDVTYLPVDARHDGAEPPAAAWKPDPERTIDHGLGFCPVHWYAHLADCSTVADYDGHAIHEDVLDEITGLDFALSQRHRAALFCGDPQITEIGVEPGLNPSQAGRTASVPATAHGGSPSNANPVTASFVSPQTRSARVKSPGAVWQYENENAKVAYLEISPDALKPLDEDAADLRNKIAETLAVVILDPNNVKFAGEMSGKAIEELRAMQFDRADEIADDFGTGWIEPVTLLLIRVALATELKIRAVKAVAADLARYLDDEGDAPMIFIKWPASYVKPDAADEQVIVTSTVAARSAPQPLITRRMALEKLAPIFGVGNVDQALEELEDEAEAEQQKSLEHAKAQLELESEHAPPATQADDAPSAAAAE